MATPDIDINQLSESQQLALQQYTAVTDQDVAAAIPLLQRSQWNIEVSKHPSILLELF
jgi:FAS-associated factor 2